MIVPTTLSPVKDSESDLNDRELCYSILYDCYEKGAFSNLSLNRDDVDDFVRAAVYGTLTYTYPIDYLIKSTSDKDVSGLDPEVRTILRFGVWQIIYSDKVPDYAAVNTSVDLANRHARSASGLINAVLRNVARLTDTQRDLSSNKSPEAAFSLKPEIYGVIKKSYGKTRAPAIAKALLSPAPLAVRTNTLKTETPRLRDKLMLEGFDVNESSLLKDSLIIGVNADSPSITGSEAFRAGEFMVQGEGAQLASILAQPKPGMSILDCCSAPGGKTTHMAALAGNHAKITALDVNASRLELVMQNAARLGAENITAKVADSTEFDTEDRYDLVLVDAPCSGLGIMGGKPDIRLTITYERIEQIRDKQRNILDNMSRLVKRGGVLVYSTCTINSAENEEQVSDFLERHGDFEPFGFDNILPESLKSRGNGGMITLLPDEDGCEGFFISRMMRK